MPITASRTGSRSARRPSSWRSIRSSSGPSLLVVRPGSFEAWQGVFANGFIKFLTFLFFVSLFYHAWIGVRDIWMDYVKPTGLRLTLHVLTVTALVGYTAWAAAILWRL